MTLDALTVGGGIGGALVEALADTARDAGCARHARASPRTTTSPALRLYQRHGFALAALRPDEIAVEQAAQAADPATGYAGIPIRDELELQRAL